MIHHSHYLHAFARGDGKRFVTKLRPGAAPTGPRKVTIAAVIVMRQRQLQPLRGSATQGVIMKALLSVVSVLLLCSCAGAPVMTGSMQSSFNGNTYTSGPTSADDPRLRSPQFYMNDDKSPAMQPVAPAPSQFGTVDNFCAANCVARRSPATYCDQACTR
jgi:hypothetical protein